VGSVRPMRDLARLAELSHTIDHAAQELCAGEPDDRRVVLALEELADGEREAAAIALSYALRRRELEGLVPVNERTIAALAATVRRMGRSD
jgi:hypothetical protein